MRKRPLGTTGIPVTEIGIGTWELSGDVWGAKDDETSLEAVRAGLEAGSNLIDTASDYGTGHVEKLIGRLLSDESGLRDQVVIATKVRPECGRFAPPPELPIAEFFSPSWIRSECENSLRRLGCEYVDVLYLHTWSRSWGHEDAWFEEMAKLKAEGKIRAIGISVPDVEFTVANVAITRGQVDVIQCVYSVFQQEPEMSLFPLAQKFGVGIITRSPFSSGVLVQQWTSDMTFPAGDWRSSWPKETRPTWLTDQIRMAELVNSVVDGPASDKARFFLRYVLEADAISAVIPGSADPAHVRGNMAASEEGTPIDPAVRRRIRELWLKRDLRGTYNGSD